MMKGQSAAVPALVYWPSDNDNWDVERGILCKIRIYLTFLNNNMRAILTWKSAGSYDCGKCHVHSKLDFGNTLEGFLYLNYWHFTCSLVGLARNMWHHKHRNVKLLQLVNKAVACFAQIKTVEYKNNSLRIACLSSRWPTVFNSLSQDIRLYFNVCLVVV